MAAGLELLSVVMKWDGRQQRREPARLLLLAGLRCLQSPQHRNPAPPQVLNPVGSSPPGKESSLFVCLFD